MKIQVKSEHIKRGRRFSCVSCPIALAMKEAGLLHVSVSNFWLEYFTPEHVLFDVDIPPTVKSFIDAFDKGKIVQPFEFEVPNAQM